MKKNKFKPRKDDKSNSPFEIKWKFCPFSQPGSPEIDYKDIRLLSRYLTEKVKSFLVGLQVYQKRNKKN